LAAGINCPQSTHSDDSVGGLISYGLIWLPGAVGGTEHKLVMKTAKTLGLTCHQRCSLA